VSRCARDSGNGTRYASFASLSFVTIERRKPGDVSRTRGRSQKIQEYRTRIKVAMGYHDAIACLR
jgi:hypothetical protein